MCSIGLQSRDVNTILYFYYSAVGLQRSINSLHQFCKESLMSVNTQKSKVMIFQKQCRKSILEKHSFFLDDLQIDNVPSYSYLGSTISSNGSFTISKQKSVEKTRGSIFATKRFLDYCKFPLKICNKLFDSLFLPILLYNSEVWGAFDNMNLQIWEKDPVERLHSQFFKYYLGLNKRTPNVAARNDHSGTTVIGLPLLWYPCLFKHALFFVSVIYLFLYFSVSCNRRS